MFKDYTQFQFFRQSVARRRHTRQMIWDRNSRFEFENVTADRMPADLNVVEFGCATGISSIDPLLKIAKAASPLFRIKAVMNDLPLNDWAVNTSKNSRVKCVRY